ncbi:beta-ketoacyl synthase N-terminal-like domain-containing protein [Streptomyces sp. NPDC056002]|uniref:beta-ketoacyl synthase N-terminal-like domain-containing protein n=1 Tax=Streptomyces sp. NPDC056002 TaxID=3345675 RepID=UPI0035DD1A61
MNATSTTHTSNPNAREVVVTGIGLALPGVATYADLLGPLPGEGGFDPATGLIGRELRHKDRASRLALRAAEFALHDAGLTDADDTFTGSTAVVVSTNLGNADSVCEATETIATAGVMGLSPLALPQTSSNVIAGWVAIRYRLRGPNLSVCNGATSGLDAVAWARNLIIAGRAEAAVAVGVEPANHVVTKIFGRQSTDAAVAVVLEPADAAASRSARPRATITGYARARNLGAALVGAGVTEEGPVGLWLADEAEAAEAGESHLLAARRRIDLESQLGPLSGALGVLQCATAAAYLEGGATGNVLATAGGPRHDATAALLLAPSPALRPSTQERGQHP